LGAAKRWHLGLRLFGNAVRRQIEAVFQLAKNCVAVEKLTWINPRKKDRVRMPDKRRSPPGETFSVPKIPLISGNSSFSTATCHDTSNPRRASLWNQFKPECGLLSFGVEESVKLSSGFFQ
jgi:hypothetical protein